MNHKGEMCVYRFGVLCQEGECSNCEIARVERLKTHDGEKKASCLSCGWDGWVRPSGNSGNICPNCGGRMIVGNSRWKNYDHDAMGSSEGGI